MACLSGAESRRWTVSELVERFKNLGVCASRAGVTAAREETKPKCRYKSCSQGKDQVEVVGHHPPWHQTGCDGLPFHATNCRRWKDWLARHDFELEGLGSEKRTYIKWLLTQSTGTQDKN
jgi:hypothetical protein